MKSNDHDFDLWFFGALIDEAVRLGNMKGFNNLIASNPDLADEYFKGRMEEIEKVELPPEIASEEWTKKMLERIHKAVEKKKRKELTVFANVQ